MKNGNSKYKEIVGADSAMLDIRKYDEKLFNFLLCKVYIA